MSKSGLVEEAYELGLEVKQTKPVDAPTLQALTMTFKSLGLCKKN